MRDLSVGSGQRSGGVRIVRVVLVALLTVVMGAAGLVIAPSVASGATAVVGDLSFDSISGDSEARVTGYSGPGGAVVIPDEVTFDGIPDPLPVTIIDAFVFRSKGVTSVQIPDSVGLIASGAFQNNQLAEVALPSSLQIIGAEAFRRNRLSTIDLPNSVSDVGGYAFETNQLTSISFPSNPNFTRIHDGLLQSNRLQTVTIPDSVTEIGSLVFIGNNQLQTVDLGSSLVSIGDSAFSGNPISALTIPSSITSIGRAAFDLGVDATVSFLGPPPTIHPLDIFLGSLAKSTPGPLVIFDPQFADPLYPGGYTTPTWMGYRAAPSRLVINGCTIVPDPTPTVHTECVGAQLDGADLSGLDLRYADFRFAELGEANLANADLSEADLQMANLGRAMLHGTDLAGALLVEANLSFSDLRNADLGGARLAVTLFTGADVSGANFVGSTMSGELIIPPDLTRSGPGPVSYVVVSSTDLGVSCDPVSGSSFPVGTTTVTCTILPPESTPEQAATATFTVTATDTAEPVVNSTLPAVSGTPNAGSTVRCDPGAWTGGPDAFEYRFSRVGFGIVRGWSADPDYLVVGADRGTSLVCRVRATATSTGSSGEADSIEFAILKDSQTVGFTSMAPVGAVVGDTYVPVAVASSGLPVMLSVSGPCSLDAGTVSFDGAGSCVVTADQAGNANFEAAEPITQTVTVGAAARCAQAVLGGQTALGVALRVIICRIRHLLLRPRQHGSAVR